MVHLAEDSGLVLTIYDLANEGSSQAFGTLTRSHRVAHGMDSHHLTHAEEPLTRCSRSPIERTTYQEEQPLLTGNASRQSKSAPGRESSTGRIWRHSASGPDTSSQGTSGDISRRARR
ncbi:hypothetical protein E2C01_051220 [Portunus trituberculatus]|uniref:Uncharacterized protein n=1 Tax=Portunus trituberculatus TaxID=210409 RepID=A0A5B7GE56_PORTR|nr:hypothetical protein [Portunus trituberculatus]